MFYLFFKITANCNLHVVVANFPDCRQARKSVVYDGTKTIKKGAGVADVITSNSLFQHYFVLNDLIIKYVNGMKIRHIVNGKNQMPSPKDFPLAPCIILNVISPKRITRMSFIKRNILVELVYCLNAFSTVILVG